MKESKQTIIDDSTSVRVGLVIVFIGLASWITMIYAATSDNTKQLDGQNEMIKLQESRISNMEGDIKVIRNILEREYGG